jgi:hypothetical protein
VHIPFNRPGLVHVPWSVIRSVKRSVIRSVIGSVIRYMHISRYVGGCYKVRARTKTDL